MNSKKHMMDEKGAGRISDALSFVSPFFLPDTKGAN
jgi:hypothetical protein